MSPRDRLSLANAKFGNLRVFLSLEAKLPLFDMVLH